MRKFLLLLVSLALLSCDNATLSTSGGEPASGQVAVRVNLGPVGALARTMAMSPRKMLIALHSPGQLPILDTIPIPDDMYGPHSYKVAIGADWTLDVAVLDQRDSLLYAGSKPFRKTGLALDIVEISLAANYSSLRLAFPILDSVSRVVVRIDSAIWGDSSLTAGTRRGDTLWIERDYLEASPAGSLHRFDLEVHGHKLGIDTLLYRLDTTLPIHSGWKENHGLRLSWVGPDTTTARGISVTMGTIGQTRIVATYGGAPLPPFGPDFGVPWGSFAYDTLLDPRDGQSYRTTVIKGQTWMAEDLRYAGAQGTTGRCIANSADSCRKYGRMYRWSEAMGLDPRFDTTWLDTSELGMSPPTGPAKRGVCPSGWSIPSWEQAMNLLSGGGIAGAYLKSSRGWAQQPNGASGDGLDMYGFRGLPAGDLSPSGASGTGFSFMFHTTRETSAKQLGVLYIRYTSGIALLSSETKTYGLPVRCVKD